MLESFLAVLGAYLLGSVSGSLLLGRLKRVDIRTMGSGNAGGTNALRSVGVTFALGVVIIDAGKGALAAGLLPGLAGATAASVPAWCGFAAVFGHCYPIWHGFRGGKGMATLIGTVMVLNPWLLIPMLLAWVLTLLLTGYVGVATVVSAASLVPAALWLGGPEGILIYAAVSAAFIAFTHRSNFRNLAAGTEHRFENVRVLHRLRGSRRT
ncbi:MAG: glycerol-3-phosphate 1-O-acyltransferase PlsY [Xanthomonadales bacterium]|jgi:glycerol-3-phosphate acyltransferase PlsY|nr:glycerol-3-phosphate 1-O-acyltransferase PlsY [Xanthomonadales bacterium]